MRKKNKSHPDYRLFPLILVSAALLSYFFFGKITELKPEPDNTPASFKGSYEDFQLAGLRPDSTAAEVSKIYGEPLTVKKASLPSMQNPDYLIYLQDWFYPGLRIEFINNGAKTKNPPKKPGAILSITVKSRNYPTFRRIRVGDLPEKVFGAYGKINPDGDTYTYCEDSQYIEFEIAKNKITAISVGRDIN